MAFENTSYTPITGLNDVNVFPTTPVNEAAARKQIQDVFDQIRDGVNSKVVAVLNSTTDSSSGADNVGATAIIDLDGATAQAILESIRNKLKGVADGASGADFVATTGIVGLTGANVQTLLEALKSHVDTYNTNHKLSTSADHDNRYYTDTEVDAFAVKLIGNQTVAGIKTLSSSPIVPTPTTDFQASTKKYADDVGVAQSALLTTHKISSDHDGRYYTETETDAFTVKLTGAQTIAGVKTFSSSPIAPAPTTDLQVSTKKYVDDVSAGVVLGQIPDGSITDVKLSDTAGQIKDTITTHQADGTNYQRKVRMGAM